MNVQRYAQKNYDGGLNDTADPREIARNEASILRNWDITLEGQLRRRDGLTQTGNTIHATNPITGLGAFIRNAGSDLLALAAATSGTSLYYLNGSTWSELDTGFTTGGLFWIENVQAEGLVFIGNEDNQLHTWDRSSTTLDACLTDLGAAAPHGNVMRWHKNHMFQFNNVNVSGTKHANRLYWSSLGDPTTYNTTDDFFEVPGDGRGVTMVDLGDSLVLFKERAIQYLTGWGSTNWAITSSSSNVANVSEQVGCIAPRGATRVGNEVWFIDDEGIIRRLFRTDFDAFRHDVISTKLQTTLSGINKTQLSKAVMASWNDKVFVALPNETSTANDLVLVYDLIASRRNRSQEAWVPYTGWTPNLFAEYPTSTTPDLYVGDNQAGKVYLHDGVSDAGTAIDARWDSKDDDYDKTEQYKRYRFARGRATTQSGGGQIEIHASVDQGPYAHLGDLSLVTTGSRLGPTGSFLLGPTGNCRLGGGGNAESRFLYTDGGGTATGRTVRHSIRHQSTTEQPVMGMLTSYFQVRAPR